MTNISDEREMSREEIKAYLKAAADLEATKHEYLRLRAELRRMEKTILALDPQWDPNAPTEELKSIEDEMASIEEKLPALKDNKKTKRGYFRELIAHPLAFSVIKRLMQRGSVNSGKGRNKNKTYAMAEK